MKLLLAVESTRTAELIVRQMAGRPWPDNVTARVLTAVEETEPLARFGRAAADLQFNRRESNRRAARVAMQGATALVAIGIPAEPVVETGDPRSVIVAAAEDWPADMIIVRSHVHQEVERWLLGSVAQAVLRHAPCSVLIVRPVPRDEESPYDWTKVLLATDGSEQARAAAFLVAARPWPEKAGFKVVGVIDTSAYPAAAGRRLHRRDEWVYEAVNEAVGVLKRGGLEATGLVRAGHPKAQIIEEARQWRADLVVLGAQGLRPAGLLGGVAEAVAQHAHCSVEVVRPLLPTVKSQPWDQTARAKPGPSPEKPSGPEPPPLLVA